MVKKYDITIPKQDYISIVLGIKDNNQYVQLGENDKLFFTVSSFPSAEEYKIQKTLENGITYDTETKKYVIILDSEDTKELQYEYDYGYDIVIYYDGDKPKQKIIGNFKISDKYTINEVV